MKASIFMAALFFLAACGDDNNASTTNGEDYFLGESTADAGNDASESPQATVLLPCDDTTTSFGFEGTVFSDDQNKGDSEYSFTQGTALPDVSVEIVTPKGTHAGTTCADGTFRVRAGVSPFFVDIQPTRRVNTVNDSEFLGAAMAAGNVNVVVFGDSVPHYGPVPWFPNVLRDKFKPYGDVTLTNVAVPGSRSVDWVPGTRYFDNDLRPELDGADLVVFSLGGNDLQEFANGLDASNISTKIGELTPLIEGIEANLSLIIAEVRAEAPQADIVWILYPNYAKSSYWADYLGSYQSAGVTLLNNQLGGVRRYMADEPIVLADMLAATADEDLDVLLSDPLHLSVEGHAFWAAEIFKTLGGVETDAEIVRRSFAIQVAE